MTDREFLINEIDDYSENHESFYLMDWKVHKGLEYDIFVFTVADDAWVEKANAWEFSVSYSSNMVQLFDTPPYRDNNLGPVGLHYYDGGETFELYWPEVNFKFEGLRLAGMIYKNYRYKDASDKKEEPNYSDIQTKFANLTKKVEELQRDFDALSARFRELGSNLSALSDLYDEVMEKNESETENNL